MLTAASIRATAPIVAEVSPGPNGSGPTEPSARPTLVVMWHSAFEMNGTPPSTPEPFRRRSSSPLAQRAIAGVRGAVRCGELRPAVRAVASRRLDGARDADAV